MFAARGGFFAQTQTGQAVVSNVINYAYQDYSQSSVSYVGPDSSNRPVFLFAYANGSNLLRAQLWRINDDGTVTQGAEQGSGSESVYRTVKVMSEYEGANSFGNGSPTNYAYLCYVNSAVNNGFVQAVQADPTNLTCTFGASDFISQSPDADQPGVAYVGNSRMVAAVRTGSGFAPKRFSRSGTTLTSEGTTSAAFGGPIDADLLGFDWDGASRYRFGQVTTQNGASGTTIAAAQQGSTNYSVSDTSIASTSTNLGCNLNNTGKMLGVSNAAGTYSVRAVTITWNASANPSLSIGTAVTFSDVTGSGGSTRPVSGHTADEAYVLYNSSATTIDYRKVTVSGTTVTLGAKETLLSGLSNFYYQMSGTSATVGTKKYLAGVQVRSSGAPYIFGYRLS